MIQINCKKVINSRGITDYSKYMRERGLTSSQISRLMETKVRSISFDLLEKLCLAFNCTPHDLLEWTPDNANQNAEWNVLQALKPKNEPTISVQSLNTMFSRLPIDKLNEISKAVVEIIQKK